MIHSFFLVLLSGESQNGRQTCDAQVTVASSRNNPQVTFKRLDGTASHLMARPKICGAIGAMAGLRTKQSICKDEKPAFRRVEEVSRVRLHP